MKPTLFIVHGGWHVPESYERLISALRADGYEVHCPRLPTTNQVSQPLPANSLPLCTAQQLFYLANTAS
jgi:alpha-beta hydrolase superfamily lysophospholipase